MERGIIFQIEIEMGNDGMQTNGDVAKALHAVGQISWRPGITYSVDRQSETPTATLSDVSGMSRPLGKGRKNEAYKEISSGKARPTRKTANGTKERNKAPKRTKAKNSPCNLYDLKGREKC